MLFRSGFRIRRYLTLGNVVLLLVLLWTAPTLLPHLGAVIGIRSGPDTTPSFAYAALDGTQIASDALRGKVVLVNFWATWCPPCRVEMPVLEAMYQRHRERGFVIIGLAIDQGPTAEIADFVRERQITYPIAQVGAQAERAFGGVRAYPTSFLVDRGGKIRHTVVGPIGAVSLEPAVRRLLRE